MIKRLLVVAMALAMGACSSRNMLDTRYVSVRPAYGSRELPNGGVETPAAAPLTIVNPDPSRPAMPAMVDEGGTWTFTTPPTTTEVSEKNGAFNQFSLYSGKPAADAKPLVVITVSADARSQAEADPETYKVTSKRSYLLNGNVAKEWSGTMKDGAAFSELVISRLGDKGDVCHAVAVARTPEERKVALEILGSIVWKANPAVGEGR